MFLNNKFILTFETDINLCQTFGLVYEFCHGIMCILHFAKYVHNLFIIILHKMYTYNVRTQITRVRIRASARAHVERISTKECNYFIIIFYFYKCYYVLCEVS